MDKKDFG